MSAAEISLKRKLRESEKKINEILEKQEKEITQIRSEKESDKAFFEQKMQALETEIESLKKPTVEPDAI